MSLPFTSKTISGYNASPPSDDGAETTNNEITWAKHKTKLGDPIKTLAEAINTELLSAFAKLFGANISTHSTAYTVVAADRGKFLSVSGTTTITLLPVATAGEGFPIAIVNTGSNTVTVDANSSETINGSTSFTIRPNAGAILTCNGTLWVALLTLGTEGTGSLLDSDKLDGQEGAYYLARANHTGTQVMATISDAGALATLDSVAAGQIDTDAVQASEIDFTSTDVAFVSISAGESTKVINEGIWMIYKDTSAASIEVQIQSTWREYVAAVTIGAFALYSDGTNMRVNSGTGLTWTGYGRRIA